MRLRVCIYLFGALNALLASGSGAQNAPATVPNYAKAIRPILQARCVVCHNEAALKNPAISGGLALDSFAALKKGVAGRAVFVAGKSAESELYRRLIVISPTKLMPKGGPPLPADRIAIFKKWLDAGAPAGDLAAEAKGSKAGTGEIPMPALPATREVRLDTLLRPAAELLPKETPKEATLAFTWKIGPLPTVAALAYSPDGTLLAVGGYRSVMIWSVATGKIVGSLTHLSGPVLALAFKPDGSQLAIAGGVPGVSGETRIYDVKTWTPVGSSLTGHGDLVYSVSWNRAGTQIATASQDKTARLWEWPSGKELRVFKEHSDAVYRVCFAPDGKSLYTAGQDRTIRRYDVANGTLMRSFTGHNEGINALAVNMNGSRVITAGAEPHLRWWNPEDGNIVHQSHGHSVGVNEVVVSKDNQWVASAGADQIVRLWDGNGNFQKELRGAADWLYAVAISPDAKFVASGGADGVVRIWEAATARLRLMLCAWPAAAKGGTPDYLALTPEGFFEASPGWTKLLRAFAGPKPVQSSALLTFLPTLRQPESLLKAWKGEPLEPAKLPAPAQSNPATTPPPQDKK
jgi:cytochrome c551/c552